MNQPGADRTPLLVFADDWGRHPSSCQHLVGRLLDRHPTTWVNTIGTRPPRFDLATIKRVAGKLRSWSRSAPSAATESRSPRVLEPRMWPWFRSTWDRALNRRLLLRQLEPVLAGMAVRPVAVTTVPIVADLVGLLPVARWVYYRVDDFGTWPGLDGVSLDRMDRDLIARADTIITAGEELREQVVRQGRDAMLLTHGVDLDHWAQPIEPNEVTGPVLQNEPNADPRVVFWGLVDRRIDRGWLAELDRSMASGTIALVGPEQNPDPALRDLPRVRLEPAVAYGELPRIAAGASVLILPYVDDVSTRALQPLKLTEYLASGRPIVARDLPATRPWSDALDLADSPASFVDAVRLRLATGITPAQRQSRQRLAAESWDGKAVQFERRVFAEGTATR